MRLKTETTSITVQCAQPIEPIPRGKLRPQRVWQAPEGVDSNSHDYRRPPADPTQNTEAKLTPETYQSR